jgi:hypothetical protein
MTRILSFFACIQGNSNIIAITDLFAKAKSCNLAVELRKTMENTQDSRRPRARHFISGLPQY